MVAENVKNIRERIAAACVRVGRQPEGITLIAVAKTFPSDKIRDAVRAGVADIGENYVQELQQKQRELDGEQIRWHFIGHLQSNKVKNVVGAVQCIHSVDSLSLGREISKHAARRGSAIDILVEVNTSREASKFGVSPEEAPDIVRKLIRLTNINITGFMTIGPLLPDPEQSRPAFRILRELKESLDRDGIRLPHLSMGMTNDFEIAIEEGSTMVRIGTALFGRRKKQNAPAISTESSGG